MAIIKCRNCGKDASDRATNCMFCKAPIQIGAQEAPMGRNSLLENRAPQQPTTAMKSSQSQGYGSSNGRSTVIKRSNSKKSVVATAVVLAIALTIFVVVSFFRIIDSARASISDPMNILMIYLFLFALSMLLYVQAFAISKSFVCVCNDRIYGIAGKASFFATQPFEIGFDQITSVKKHNSLLVFLFTGGGNIKIECGPHVYKCLINDPDEIVKLINSLRSKHFK